ncbi:MAG: type II toxin-antitoxin system HipA family toxin [Cyanobacteriota bacterium]
MGRPSQTRQLAVWMNGERVGDWWVPGRGPQEFVYDPAWLSSPQFRPLSLSLPVGLGAPALRGVVVEQWFANLLPDNEAILSRLQRRFSLRGTSAFELLEAVGRDCAGAVQLLPPEEEPTGLDRIEATPLSDEAIGTLLQGVVAEPLPGSAVVAAGGPRLSIAGAQEKTALLWHQNQWCRPRGSTPTTHLFKLPMGRVGSGQIDFSSSVENEWLCGRILAAYGLQVAPSRLANFAGRRCLIVERFDRRLHASGSHWLRLPVEDLCQATGTPPEQKYENQGGPGMVAISALLAQSAQAAEDLRCFFQAQVLFWMLRAIDGHAKNFSLFLLPGGSYRLTPLYDVLSAWPVIGKAAGQWPEQELRLAMTWDGSKSRTSKPMQVQLRHLISTASRMGLAAEAEALVANLVARTPEVIATMEQELPSGFPEPLAGAILAGLQGSAERLENQLS